MIIGITGGTGCGKTTALQAIASLGGTVIDCDEVYHRLLQTDNTLLSAIENRFPGTVCNGILQRKQLGALVFADPQALQDLNTITHGAVKAEVLRLLSAAPSLAAIDAIGLFESGIADLCDTTVAITAPYNQRVNRLMTRENISRDYAESRINAQKSCDSFTALCQHTLHNDSTEEAFRNKCLIFFRNLMTNTEKENCHDN